ncbi:hypothetical protein [Methanobrevibacter sp.]
MIEFNITGIEETKTYLYTVRGRFSLMLQAMIDVAEVIHANTMPLTPLDTGRLGGSFQWQTLHYSRDFIELEVKMDAVDPKSGFHYAEYQHNTVGLNHPHGQMWYLRTGINASKSMAYEIIESDYLSLFGGL